MPTDDVFRSYEWNCWSALYDDTVIFGTRGLLMLPMRPDPDFGKPGIRDSDNPCGIFDPGTPGKGECGTDGHYMCKECRHMSRKAIESLLFDYPEDRPLWEDCLNQVQSPSQVG